MKSEFKLQTENLDTSNLANYLGNFVPIKSLSPENLKELADKSELMALSKGRYAFKQGEKLESICYLLRGSVEIIAEGGNFRVVEAGSTAALLPLEQSSVHRLSARARTDAEIIKIDSNLLDIMLTWQQSGGYEVQSIDSSAEDEDSDDWMSRLLQAKVFHKIPPANIQSIFMRMEARHFIAGDTVIKQGAQGDSFYIIREGRCQVIRQTRKNPEGVVLANLNAGDNFGEEALISGGKRNASIIMVADGVLMHLNKVDFLELMNEPVMRWLAYQEAQKLICEGAVWIDVRLPAEYQSRHFQGSVNIPLPILRLKLAKLDPAKTYIAYCDTGRRSSTATYILNQSGYSAAVLQEGLNSVPPEDLDCQNSSVA
ncbi:MAG: cyclic nucleotide-binding domain-containing protein [Thiohalomonadales bacterium]